MNSVVRLHGQLAARPHANRVALPFDVELSVANACVDAWPNAATAAALLAGGLSLARDPSDEQLDELIAHCCSLASIGVVTAEEFEATMHAVIDQVCQWAESYANN